MRTTLHILDHTGDIELRWDHSNPQETAEARQAVLDLKRQGYSFFLVDGNPAPDEFTIGQGLLNCRRIEAESLIPETTEGAAEATPVRETDAAPSAVQPKRGRGRPRQAPPDRTVVASRPMRGG